MVHAAALTGTAGFVLDEAAPLKPFAEWAGAGKSQGSAMWMQINHPGRQVRSDMPGVVWGPSGVGVQLGRHSKCFGRPVAMTHEQIEATVARFAVTAQRTEQAGSDGVEVHAAHGYLLSQFLSPLVDRRTDQWGGSLENRARMLLEVVRAIRSTVSPSFAVAVKLNSADFQRGGFDADDAHEVIAMLQPLGTDLVELSGGSYESPAMTGRATGARIQAREAYFLDLTRDLVATSPLPLMLTGGITRRSTAEKVLASGVGLVGMGTALAVTPNLPVRWRNGLETRDRIRPVNWSDKPLASAASMAQVRHQLRRIAHGRPPQPDTRPSYALASEQVRQKRALRRYRAWLSARPAVAADRIAWPGWCDLRTGVGSGPSIHPRPAPVRFAEG